MSIDTAFPSVRARHEALTRAALVSAFKDQEADVVVAGRSLGDEWNARLARIIYTRNRNAAADVALKVAKALGAGFDPDVMDAWLTKNADLAAVGINDSTRSSLSTADDKAAVFAVLLAAGAARYARTMTTTVSNFGAHDAARAAGGESKTWTWSGKGPRHSEMNGETVPMSASFSNGLAWPSDPTGGAEEVANCACSVTFDV